MSTCPFCGSTDDLSTEHVLPQWVRRDFNIQGSLTIWATDPAAERVRHRVAGRPQLTITLDGYTCKKCNSEFLSGLETEVRPLLSPMMLEAHRTDLDPVAQGLLATWAVKTVLLLELSLRQHYPDRRLVPGYVATDQEFAWVRAERQPPPRSFVWLGCWDCRSSTPLMYEPSAAPVPTADGSHVDAHVTTFSLGFAVFQVFTVDFIAADSRGARPWNGRVPPALKSNLVRIWPEPRGIVKWPPVAFPYEQWDRLVTWDQVLRQGDPYGAV